MASEVDPLILELRADLGKYRAELRSSTALVEKQLKRQEKSVKNLERQMQRSSGAISGSLKGIAASLAGAFSVQQIGGLIDNFTRLQNALRVAGLEGEGLANVQEKLLGLSGRYGVSINDLADLYGKSSQAAAELGASEAQLLQITEASAQALKITGTSAAQAQGALLGLTQALSSGVVRAEEFNQINEGGLRPLLQVAANTEKYGGSVAKLRAAVVDGKVSSQEFYQAILQGSAELDAKASKATLTLAGAFTALASQLTAYVGEASAANGVTAGLAAAIGALADNLDKIIPALAIIGVAIGGRMAAAALVGGNALRALAAYASIATTSLAGTALAARGVGAALLGAFGGPVGLAITALVLGIGYLATQSDKTAAEIDALSSESDKASETLKRLREEAEKADGSVDGLGNAADASKKKLSGAAGAANALARELFGVHAAALIAADALADKNLQLAKERSARNRDTDQRSPFAKMLGVEKGSTRADRANREVYDEGVANAEADKRLTQEALRKAYAAQREARSAGDSNAPSVSTATGANRKGKGAGASGPSAEEIEARFNNELIGLTQQTLSAQQSIATSAQEKADIELRSIELARLQAIEGIKAEKDYTDAQKQRLIQQVETLVFEEQEAVAVRTRAQLAQEAADLAEAQSRNEMARLEDEYDLATSIKDRARIAAQIAETETQAALDAIDRQLLDQDISEAKRQQLEAIRAGVVADGEISKRKAAEGNRGAAGEYLDQINKMDFGDQAEKFGVDALKDLNSGLADAIVNGGNLGDVLEDTGKRFLAQLIELTFQLLVIKPLLESLGGGFGGIGSVGGFLSGIFGRASGGPVSAGQVYRVNEGVGKEFFRPSTGGDIIPLSKMNAAQSGGGHGGGVSVVRLELSGDIDARIQSTSAQVAVEVVRASAPSIVEASAAKARRDMGRPRM